ncbi:insulin-like 3 (Leydig cell) [Conger conger]|uniref:insulin-like 3 (Leydig cell) n=1 Tax=Conger conger TaxID=82655 RepID=UPI002A59F7EB|nr:insulin-like 3 (Leydig cell) [Conger conger]
MALTGRVVCVVLSVLLTVGLQGAHCQDVRVKLCGREFIRMVVTSCGSTRLRRSAALSVHPHGNQPHPDHPHGNQPHPDHPHGNQPHPDPNVFAGESPLQVDHLPTDDPTSSRSEVAGGVSELYRTRRSPGPAGLCCRSGCTMSELVQYC